MKEKMREVWCRIGFTLSVTPEEMDQIVDGGKGLQEAVLAKVFASRRAVLSGDSYIPDCIIQQCNEEYGTHYPNRDVELETGKLDGTVMRPDTGKQPKWRDAR